MWSLDLWDSHQSNEKEEKTGVKSKERQTRKDTAVDIVEVYMKNNKN